jgi:hypothetical protein
VTRAKISQYSATANDNTDVNGVNIAENCPPSSMNNMGREIMAALKRFQTGSDGDGVTVGGALVVSGSTTVNTFNVDVISEKTSAAGVTIDGVLLKDSLVGIGANGSASAPAIYRSNDTNTGIFFPAADTIAFAEGGAEAMRIDSSGNVLIGKTSATANGGDLQVSKGITFPATQSAQSDANTLDDYEEGTWTPAFAANGNPFTSVGHTVQSGRYIKVGSLVYVSFLLRAADASTIGSASGGLIISGLPFTPSGSANQRSAGSVGQTFSFASGVTEVPQTLEIRGGDAFINLNYFSAAGGATSASTFAVLRATATTNGNSISGAIAYTVF